MRLRDEAKTAAIYKATLLLVKDRGLAGITMNDISKEASIATGTLYIYFKNKEELIKALFLECRQQSAEQYFEGIDPKASFEKRFKKVFTNIITYKLAYYEVSAFLEQSYHSPFFCANDMKKKQKALDPLFDMINEGIEKKKIRETDVDLVVSFLFGIINELVKKTYFSSKKLLPEKIDSLYTMFWNGIKK